MAPRQPSTHAHTPGGIECIMCDRRVTSTVAFVGATKSGHRPCRPHAGHSTEGGGGGGGGGIDAAAVACAVAAATAAAAA